MKASEALIAWTPGESHKVKVGPLLRDGTPDWTVGYDFTGGAAYTARRKMVGDAADRMLFIEFHTLVVRDGIDPQAAHREFLKIDEYAEAIAPDIPGARYKEEE